MSKNLVFYNISNTLSTFIPVISVVSGVLIGIALYILVKRKYTGLPSQLFRVISSAHRLDTTQMKRLDGGYLTPDLINLINQTFVRTNQQQDAVYVANMMSRYENAYMTKLFFFTVLPLIIFLVMTVKTGNIFSFFIGIILSAIIFLLGQQYKNVMLTRSISKRFRGINLALNTYQILELDILLTFLMCTLNVSKTMTVSQLMQNVLPLVPSNTYDIKAFLADLNRVSVEESLVNWMERVNVVYDIRMQYYTRLINQINKIFIQGENNHVYVELFTIRDNIKHDFEEYLEAQMTKRFKNTTRGMMGIAVCFMLMFILPLLLSTIESLRMLF